MNPSLRFKVIPAFYDHKKKYRPFIKEKKTYYRYTFYKAVV